MQQLTPEQRRQARANLKAEIKNEIITEVYGRYMTIDDLKTLIGKISTLEKEIEFLKESMNIQKPQMVMCAVCPTIRKMEQAMMTGATIGEMMEITGKTYSNIMTHLYNMRKKGYVTSKSNYDNTFSRSLIYKLTPKYYADHSDTTQTKN